MYVQAARQKAGHYSNIQSETYLDDATPHQLIQLLMDGFLARVNAAKGAIQQSDYEAKSLFISKAIGILGGLSESLNYEQGGEIAQNLGSLYQYMQNRLLEGSAENNLDMMDEVLGLMRDIKSAWDAIQ